MYPYQGVNQPNRFFPVCRDLPERLIKAMTGEQNARRYYQQLMSMAPSEEDKAVIAQIYDDEGKHFENFNTLYKNITGQQPALPPPEVPNIPTYLQGVEKAIFDETDAYEFYRDTYMCTINPIAKEIFFEAFTDENEHAIRLTYLYSKNK